MIGRRVVINVITFFVMSALLIVLLFVQIFRVKPTYSVAATFADSGGVFTGQEVTYRGVTVGRVGEMTVVPEGVRIRLVVEEAFNRIPSDARARVMYKSAVGEQFVDLLPQSRRGPYLRNGSKIPKDRTELPVQQEDLLRLLDAVVEGVPPEAFKDLVTTLGTGLSGKGDGLGLALQALDPITAVLARRVPELNRLAQNADRAGAAFDRSSGDFVRGAGSLADVATSLRNSSSELARVLQEGSRTAPELAALVAARKIEIDRTIASLAVVTRVSYAKIKSVDATLKWLPLFLGSLAGAYDGTRFRFGLVTDLSNPPCDYGTPRRGPTDLGDKPPVTAFQCPGGAQATTARPPASPTTGPLHDTRGPAPQPSPTRGLLKVLTDAIR